MGITPVYDYDEELMYAWSVETDEGKMTFAFFDLGYGEVYFDGVYVADLYWYIHGGLYMETVDYETGESEVMVENADYFIDEEDKLFITYEGETLVLVKDEEFFEYPDTSFVVPDNAEYDSAVVGAWVYYEDGMAMIFTFNADGEGSVKMDGITLDVIWYTLDGKISVGMSLFGLTETLFEDLDYVAEEDSITLDDGFDIIVLTSYDAALENGNSQAPDEDHDSALVGTWAVDSAGMELTVVFKADGTGTASAEGVTFGVNWSTNDGLISAELVYGGEVQPFYDNNVYTVDGDTFTVTFSDGADVYTKIA